MKHKHISLNMRMGLWLSAAAILASASSPFSNQFLVVGKDAVPLEPVGWSDPIVLTKTAGTNISDATLEAGSSVFVDFAITNNGTVNITETFNTCLYLDGTLVNCWSKVGLASGVNYLVEDYVMAIPVQEGSHTLELRVDEAGVIGETPANKLNNNFAADFTWVESTPSTAAGTLMADAFTVAPGDMPTDVNGDSNAPDKRDTSTYMIGKVAVSVILPESGGIGSTENWSQTEIDQVKAEITAGLNNWETWYTASNGGNPVLDFVVEWHTNADAVPVSILNDPIALNGISDDDVWINESLGVLGATGATYWARAYAYNNTIRTANSADWAFTIFVVDSSSDSDGRFAPAGTGSFAYSYLNGPFLVMTYDNANWGISQMNEVLAHQVAHIFGAADQYPAGCINTTDLFGYLEIANSNCGGANPSSLMFTGQGIPDITTQGQVGWRDTDADQIFDPADTRPLIINFIDETPSFTGTNHLFSGTAYDNPWTHPTRPITIRKLIAIEYRIDGGAWQNADPATPPLDSDFESFSFSTPNNLGGGNHTVEVRAQNNSTDPINQYSIVSSLSLSFSNDFYNSSMVIPSLPFTNIINTTSYTAGEPQDKDLIDCGGDPNLDRAAGDHSAWYRYTPTINESVTLDTIGSNVAGDTTQFDTMIGVYLDMGFGELNQIGCDDDSAPSLKSLVTVPLAANRTYYFAASSFNGAIFGSLNSINKKSGVGALAGDNDPGGTLVFHATSNGEITNFPFVLSSVRVDPSPVPFSTVRFIVTFSESVTGVDEGDFTLTTTGISGAAVSGISGSGNTYTVSVNTGSGNGTLRLNVISNGTIMNAILYPLAGDFTSGETYIIDKNYPYVLSSLRANPNPTTASSVNFTVSFSESVTGVDAGDFTLATIGVPGAAISGVSGSGSTYTVSVSTGTGNGTIRLYVIDNDTIINGTFHSLFSSFTSGEIYRIKRTPIFDDVPFSYWANDFVERLYYAGVTGGCSITPLNYCPDSTVTRAQMAIFLLRGIHGSSYSPPDVGAGTGFTDVPVGYWADKWIKQLSAEGITGGCGVGIYCPDATVTRAQMAIFLLRAKYGSSYLPPAATGVFTDVPVGYWADKWIEQLAVEGITSGCGAGIYCPDSPVTRAQMAVFLVRTFNLP